MTVPLSVMGSAACALFRSSLHICDRLLYSRHPFDFLSLYFLAILFPLGICAPILLGVENVHLAFFFSPSCLLVALSTHMVSLSFSYALKHQSVQKVVLRTKLPELVLPLIMCIPCLSVGSKFEGASLISLLPLALSWIAVTPLLAQNRFKQLLVNKITLYVSGSLLLQILVSSFAPFAHTDFAAVVELTIAILFWRCAFTLPFCFRKLHRSIQDRTIFSRQLLGLIFLRSLLAIFAQMSFSLCILKGNPIVIWPILNMTPLISATASQLVLGETLQKGEAFAISGFTLAAIAPWALQFIQS